MRKEISLNASTAGRSDRAAFTLVEMLVSIGLMLLVMSLFAEIFSLAVTAMTTQIGLAKNDQRARTAFIVIDNDLKRMSFRALDGQQGIVPLVPGLRYNGVHAGSQQQGYIYYSENNPVDDTEDVLQFTVMGSQQSNRYPGQLVDYYGRANSLTPSGVNDDPRFWSDQPDWDDGTNRDGVSVSGQAEVTYFLRHGTLYRRTLLLRDATSTPDNLQPFETNNQQRSQPAVLIGGVPTDLMRSAASSPPAPVTGYTGNFYSDFDYSAHYGNSPYDPSFQVAIFHGSLNNSADGNWPLGVPHFRFGHSSSSGRPREYFVSGGTDYFFGRYTHEETSNTNFQYPQSITGNVFGRNDFDLNFYLATGRLDKFADGSRRGTDILMNNVHSFDVEIWDDRANRFVDIGSTNANDFLPANNLNTNYGPIKPNAGQVNVFDTWHSLTPGELSPLNAGVIGTGQAPYVPKNRDISTILPWAPAQTYNVGDPVKPISAALHFNGAIYYVCRPKNGLTGLSDATTEPTWPKDAIVGASEGPDTTGINWDVIDNRKPIRALRIIIRFRDPNSDQMRQMTMVHSFNEDLDE